MKTENGRAVISGGNANLVYACFTDIGKVRKVNEDNYLALPDQSVFCVADGVGSGGGVGGLASRIALDNVADQLIDRENQDNDFSVVGLIRKANDEICRQKTAIAREMATTLVLTHFQSGLVRIAHVGDSRVYLWRGGHLRQITSDHSLVVELFRHGKIRRDEMRTHPRRNVITRALGIDNRVEPELKEFVLRHGDLLLLCTDGLTSMVDDDEIAASLSKRRLDLGACGYDLVHKANRAGGKDNITLVLLRYTVG